MPQCYRDDTFHASGWSRTQSSSTNTRHFRRKGLYEGPMQGHMLGTAFYPDKRLSYQLHGYDGNDRDREIRNGLWATVLQHCRYAQKATPLPVMKTDSEAKGGALQLVRRTTQIVRHLRLWQPHTTKEYEKVKVFSEAHSKPLYTRQQVSVWCLSRRFFPYLRAWPRVLRSNRRRFWQW